MILPAADPAIRPTTTHQIRFPITASSFAPAIAVIVLCPRPSTTRARAYHFDVLARRVTFSVSLSAGSRTACCSQEPTSHRERRRAVRRRRRRDDVLGEPSRPNAQNFSVAPPPPNLPPPKPSSFAAWTGAAGGKPATPGT